MSKFIKPEREKCQVCTKSIFNDIFKANGKTYHANCVKCDTCDKKLSISSYFVNSDKFLCEKHYKELSMPKSVKVLIPKKSYPLRSDQLDSDSLTIVFSFLKVIEVGQCSLVCKQWSDAGHLDQQYWKQQSLLMWPANNHLKIEIKDWREFFNSRSNLETKEKKKILQNCNMDPMKFNCPISWDSLSATGHHKVRICNVCQEKVYHCIDLEELDQVAKIGHCVMFYPYQLTGMNLDWKSKDEYDEMGPNIVGRRCF